jgi:hypothetical protein
MRAWVVKWEWVGNHASVPDPFICVLSARLSPEEVRSFVERYYSSQQYSLPEQIAQARYNKPNEPPYTADFDAIGGQAYRGHIICGHNPFIQAFKASGVRVHETAGRLLWDKDKVKQDREKFRAAVKRHGL